MSSDSRASWGVTEGGVPCLLATLLRFFVNRPQMIIVIVCGMSQRKKRARSVYGGFPHYFCTHSCARYTLDDEQNYGQGQMGAHPWIPSKAFQNRTRFIPRASHAKPISCQMGRIIIDTLVLATPFHSKWEPTVPKPFGPMGPWGRRRLQNPKKTSKKTLQKRTQKP